MTACHKYEFQLGFDLRKNFSNGLRVHFNTFTNVVLEQEIILFLLDSMATKMQDFD